MNKKPQLSFLQIWNMSFGFLGIQFGWGLQLANMSPIYKYLGATESELPYLWLAGPLTGLLIQPIVGAMSGRTWTKFGRHRPYFLVGAILASIALVIMPNSSALWRQSRQTPCDCSFRRKRCVGGASIGFYFGRCADVLQRNGNGRHDRIGLSGVV